MAIPAANALKHAILLGEERGLRLRILFGKRFVFQTFPLQILIHLQLNTTNKCVR